MKHLETITFLKFHIGDKQNNTLQFFFSIITIALVSYSFYPNMSTNFNLDFRAKWYWDQTLLEPLIEYPRIICLTFGH